MWGSGCGGGEGDVCMIGTCTSASGRGPPMGYQSWGSACPLTRDGDLVQASRVRGWQELGVGQQEKLPTQETQPQQLPVCLPLTVVAVVTGAVPWPPAPAG